MILEMYVYGCPYTYLMCLHMDVKPYSVCASSHMYVCAYGCFSTCMTYFGRNYKAMDAWLLRDPLTEEELEDKELVEEYEEDTKDVWGYWKNGKYGLQDLITWVENAETERLRLVAEAGICPSPPFS